MARTALTRKGGRSNSNWGINSNWERNSDSKKVGDLEKGIGCGDEMGNRSRHTHFIVMVGPAGVEDNLITADVAGS
jgi:hypothetical protein